VGGFGHYDLALPERPGEVFVVTYELWNKLAPSKRATLYYTQAFGSKAVLAYEDGGKLVIDETAVALAKDWQSRPATQRLSWQKRYDKFLELERKELEELSAIEERIANIGTPYVPGVDDWLVLQLEDDKEFADALEKEEAAEKALRGLSRIEPLHYVRRLKLAYLRSCERMLTRHPR
jgi:hypothetical protein